MQFKLQAVLQWKETAAVLGPRDVTKELVSTNQFPAHALLHQQGNLFVGNYWLNEFHLIWGL